MLKTNRIYIMGLNPYNNGELKGEWVELPSEREFIKNIINKYTNNGKTDYIISSIESDFKYAFDIKKNSNIYLLNEIFILMEELDLDETQLSIVKSLMENNIYSDPEDCVYDVYKYEGISIFYDCETMEDVARLMYGEQADDIGYLGGFIDWEGLAIDIESNGNFIKIKGGYIEYYG